MILKNHSTNNSIILLTCLVFTLFSSVSFANDKDKLLAVAAFFDNDIASVERLLHEGADPKEIPAEESELYYYADRIFIKIPAPKIAELLLNNGEKSIDPNKFIDIILPIPCYKYNNEKRQDEIVEELAKQQYYLVELCLEKGADANLALQNIQKAFPVGSRWKNQRDNLTKLALKKGADSNNILAPRNQNTITDKLKTFYMSRDDYSTEKLGKSYGYCYGLTMVWLHTMWKQFMQPENTRGITHEKFTNTIKDIAVWNGKDELTEENIQNFDDLYQTIDLLQFNQNLGIETLKTMFNQGGKFIKEKRNISPQNMNLEQFTALLQDMVVNDKMVQLTIISTIGGHANGLFKHGDYYYYYEPNDDSGEYKNISIEKIAEIIFKHWHSNNYIKAGLVVYDIEDHEDKGFFDDMLNYFRG
jgi:hypothetical protein